MRHRLILAVAYFSACATYPAVGARAADAATVVTWQERHAIQRKVLLDVLDSAGEMQPLMEFHSTLRPLVEAMIEASSPGAVASLAPYLDEFFAPKAMRERIGDTLVSSVMDAKPAAVQNWIADPSMRAISVRLAEYRPVESGAAADLAPSRRERLLRLVHATMLAERINYQVRGLSELHALVSDALDPTSTAMLEQRRRNLESVVDAARMVDLWAAPALDSIGDDELEGYIAFAESDAGRSYFFALAMSWGIDKSRYGVPLSELIASEVRTPKSAASGEEVTGIVAQARGLLRGSRSSSAASQAREMLLPALAADAGNAEVLFLLGEAELRLSPADRPGYDELRTFATPHVYDEAEKYLRLAIEVDPKHAEALQLLGRVKFFKSEDDEATRLLDRAQEADPRTRWIRHAQADMATVRGENDKAIRLYREILEAPENAAEQNGHSAAFSNAFVAFRQSGRLDAYAELGQAYLAKHPDAGAIRIRLADHLLDTDANRDRIIAMVEQSADANPPLARAVHVQALALRAKEESVEDGNLSLRAQKSLAEAEARAGSRSALFERLCWRPSVVPAAVLLTQIGTTSDESMQFVLWCALRQRDVPSVRAMADAGVDISAASRLSSDTPLNFAVTMKQPEMFEMLLERGADPSVAVPAYPNSPLVDRITKLDPKTAKRFLDALEKHTAGIAAE